VQSLALIHIREVWFSGLVLETGYNDGEFP